MQYNAQGASYNTTGGAGFVGNSPMGGGGMMGGGMMGGGMDVQGSQGGSQGAGGADGQRPKNTLVPITVHMVHAAVKDDTDEQFKIDGRAPSQVTIVARVLKVSPQSAYYSYTLDDGTGQIDARVWIDKDENGSETDNVTTRRMKECTEGAYVRFFGRIREFNKQRNLLATRITVIKDLNEVTYHGLEVIQSHIDALKAQQATAAQAQSQPTNVANPAAGYGSSFQPPGQAIGGAPVGGASEMHQGLNETQSNVLNVIMRSTDEQMGSSIKNVADSLRLPVPEVRKAIDFLSEEGLLYSTVDDEHYKYAMSS